MTQPPIDNIYFEWLYSRVGSVSVRNKAQTYWTLLLLLYRLEFTWDKIERDANRAQDGKDLRTTFTRETHTVVDQPGWLEEPCSVLEMLIALAMQINFISEKPVPDVFWEMLANLGMGKEEGNDAYPLDHAYVTTVVTRMMNREYDADGLGGLFPLQEPHQDQRDVELWYQANAYLLERL